MPEVRAKCKTALETINSVHRFGHAQALVKCELAWMQWLNNLLQAVPEASAKCKPAQKTATNVHRFKCVQALGK